MKKTTIILIAITIVIILILGFVTYLIATKPTTTQDTTGENTTNVNACEQIGCSSEDKYVGSRNSDKYYECSCRYAKNINQENLVCFKTDEEALADDRIKSEC